MEQSEKGAYTHYILDEQHTDTLLWESTLVQFVAGIQEAPSFHQILLTAKEKAHLMVQPPAIWLLNNITRLHWPTQQTQA